MRLHNVSSSILFIDIKMENKWHNDNHMQVFGLLIVL